MIKNLLFILCTMFSCQILAQTCTPDPTFADSAIGVYPLPFYEDTGLGGITLDATIGCPYEFVFQAVVPDVVDFMGTEVPLGYVSMDSTGALLNLPVGLTYACNPPNCFFNQNTIGCLVIYGTPEASNTSGTFDVKIAAEVELAGAPIQGEFPSELFTQGGNYYLELLAEPTSQDDCPSITSVNNNQVTPFDFTLTPNPTYGSTTLTIEAEDRNTLNFKIMSLTGVQIQQQILQVEQGTNTFEVVVTDVPEGIYLYSLGNEKGILTNRIMITK